MGEPIELGRICGRCGAQVVLSVEGDHGYYTDDLTALLATTPTAKVRIVAKCDCPTPRTVTLEGTSWRPGTD